MNPPVIGALDAHLVERDREDQPGEHSWFITHGLGGPAENTYTEVVMPLAVDRDGEAAPEHVIEQVAREVAVKLYGTAWAFIYPPAEYQDAIERWSMRRRERVVVESFEVWG